MLQPYDPKDEIAPMRVGSAASDFTLKTESEKNWSLLENLGHVTILLFYPQNETLVCTKQLCSVRDNWEKYLETKAVIVGISPATPEEHQIFSQSHQLPIPLLSDPDRKITKLFAKHWLYPIQLTRAVVVIDANGIIRNRDIMLRAFRPSDSRLITDIYAARGDAFNETYTALRNRISKVLNK